MDRQEVKGMQNKEQRAEKVSEGRKGCAVLGK